MVQFLLTLSALPALNILLFLYTLHKVLNMFECPEMHFLTSQPQIELVDIFVCSSWEENSQVISYIQDIFFLPEKRGPAVRRLTWCSSQGGQAAWVPAPLKEVTTWLRKRDQFALSSSSQKKKKSHALWWWVSLHIKACSWVAGILQTLVEVPY